MTVVMNLLAVYYIVGMIGGIVVVVTILLHNRKPIPIVEARQMGVCRLCLKPAEKTKWRNDVFVLNYGEEYAHRSCLIKAGQYKRNADRPERQDQP